MKYAPEAMYGMPGGNNAWISQQFKDDTAGYGKGVTIAATPATARNPRPEYALMIADESGALTPVYDENGMPSAWQPDFTETQDYKDLQELPEKTIAAAQEKRERYKTQKLNKLAGLIRSKEFLKKNKNYANAINNALLAEEINEVEADQLKVLFNVEQKEQSSKSAKPKNLILSDARYGELGEIKNPDGTTSTEYSITEYVPELGGWVNIPSLVKGQVDVRNLLDGNQITRQQMGIAIRRAIARVENGAMLPSYPTVDEALKAADSRTPEEKYKPYKKSAKPKRKPLSTPSKSVKQSEENLKNLTEDELIQAYKEARPGPFKESLGRALSAMVDSSMNDGGA
jgi:hypothetical protein